jgi:hypothetical protein
LCWCGKPLIRCTLSGQRRDPRLKAGRWSAVSKKWDPVLRPAAL